MTEHRSRHESSLRNHIIESSSDKPIFRFGRRDNYWLYVGRVLHGKRFRCGDLSKEKAEFYWIAWAGITCCDVVQHRDRDRIAGAIVDEPADCRIVIDAIESDLMSVSRQDRLQKIEEEGDGSTNLREDQWIVGGQPQFVGCRIQDDIGQHVGHEKGLMLGHAGIYPVNFVSRRHWGRWCGRSARTPVSP
jgi:hypothetical protein